MTMTSGLQRETAGRGTMAIYVQVIFALVFERIFFHTTPPPLSILGTVIILSSAIYVAVSLVLHGVPSLTLEPDLATRHSQLSKQAATNISRKSSDGTLLEGGLLVDDDEVDETDSGHEMDKLPVAGSSLAQSVEPREQRQNKSAESESDGHGPESGSSTSARTTESV